MIGKMFSAGSITVILLLILASTRGTTLARDRSIGVSQLAQAQYNVGQINLLSVLIIQAQWVGSQVGVVNIRSDRLTQRVDLHPALGGSFESKRTTNEGAEDQ